MRVSQLGAVGIIACVCGLQGACTHEIGQPPDDRDRSPNESATDTDGSERSDADADGAGAEGQTDGPADSDPGGANAGESIDDPPPVSDWQPGDDPDDASAVSDWQPGDGTYAPGAECKEVSQFWGPFGKPGETADAHAVPISALPIDLLPEWPSDALQPAFERIRDERFLCDPRRPDFPRRLTWLNPNGGCEMRAELVGWKLAEWGYARPFKIFLIGPMQVATPNTRSGTASWGWHVASAVRVANRGYVLDAAIEPRRPLTVEEWTQRVTTNIDGLTGAVCDYAAFQPDSPCFGGSDWATGTAIATQQSTFADEWDLQLALGRDPQHSLGDSPPWVF